MAINVVTKKQGDLLTATEFNAVVQGIKDNEDNITTLGNKVDNVTKMNGSIFKNQVSQASDISKLKDMAVKMVVISQDDYDALVKAGTVDKDTYYNILEE